MKDPLLRRERDLEGPGLRSRVHLVSVHRVGRHGTGRWLLALLPAVATISVACKLPFSDPVDFTGSWVGHARMHSCPGDYDSCLHDAEMDLVQAGERVTGVLRIDGVPDLFEVTSSDPSWNGLQLVGHAECAQLSARFLYPETIVADLVTIDRMSCPDPSNEEWDMEFRRAYDF